MNQRDSILSLFNGQPPADVPSFSGLIHVTIEGVKHEGLAWTEIHHDAAKMARAAASTFRTTRLPSATLPLDFCAPAEVLGAELAFYGEEENMLPQVKRAVAESAREINSILSLRASDSERSNPLLGEEIASGGQIPPSQKHTTLTQGRMPLILNAIRRTKSDIGEQAVISGLLPGPYTLLLYLCNPAKLFIEMKKEPQVVTSALLQLSTFLARIGMAYREAGADFITVHEMGGSPGFLGPARYEQFVHPALKALIENLPKPRVLSVCGDATKSLALVATSGAEAISLDQTVDLAAARSALGEILLFGNVDPVATLWRGDPHQARVSARRAEEAGADAVWPGCDLVPSTPIRNLQALSTFRN